MNKKASAFVLFPTIFQYFNISILPVFENTNKASKYLGWPDLLKYQKFDWRVPKVRLKGTKSSTGDNTEIMTFLCRK